MQEMTTSAFLQRRSGLGIESCRMIGPCRQYQTRTYASKKGKDTKDSRYLQFFSHLSSKLLILSCSWFPILFVMLALITLVTVTGCAREQ